jgi:hypothetical protein
LGQGDVVLSEKVVWVFAKIGSELIYNSILYVAPLSLVEFRCESPGMYKLNAELSSFGVAFSFLEF